MAGLVVVAFLATMVFATAQEPVDPAFLLKALDAVTNQRNNSQNGEASALARSALQAEEIERLRAEIKKLKEAAEPKDK